jgi:hypothetical protein
MQEQQIKEISANKGMTYSDERFRIQITTLKESIHCSRILTRKNFQDITNSIFNYLCRG